MVTYWIHTVNIIDLLCSLIKYIWLIYSTYSVVLLRFVNIVYFLWLIIATYGHIYVRFLFYIHHGHQLSTYCQYASDMFKK